MNTTDYGIRGGFDYEGLTDETATPEITAAAQEACAKLDAAMADRWNQAKGSAYREARDAYIALVEAAGFTPPAEPTPAERRARRRARLAGN